MFAAEETRRICVKKRWQVESVVPSYRTCDAPRGAIPTIIYLTTLLKSMQALCDLCPTKCERYCSKLRLHALSLCRLPLDRFYQHVVCLWQRVP